MSYRVSFILSLMITYSWCSSACFSILCNSWKLASWSPLTLLPWTLIVVRIFINNSCCICDKVMAYFKFMFCFVLIQKEKGSCVGVNLYHIWKRKLFFWNEEVNSLTSHCSWLTSQDWVSLLRDRKSCCEEEMLTLGKQTDSVHTMV